MTGSEGEHDPGPHPAADTGRPAPEVEGMRHPAEPTSPAAGAAAEATPERLAPGAARWIAIVGSIVSFAIIVALVIAAAT